MGKIMTNLDLISRMKELLNEPNFYGSGGNKWSSWQNGKGWYVDCTCSIKAILWGGRFIPENRGKAHAGCDYKSNGVPDFTPASCVQWTGATKGNFRNLIPGEILLMTSHSHAGLYIGNGEVIEVTPAWTGGTPGCQISKIGVNGERVKNGIRTSASWEYHGKLPVIDYINEPAPAPKPEPTKELKYKAGDRLRFTGVLYADSYGNGAGQSRENLDAIISAVNNNAKATKPYNINRGLGWVAEEDLHPFEPAPQPEPTPQPTVLNIGDKVKIVGTGNGASDGSANTAYGIGWTRYIKNIYVGRAFPYQVGDNTGTTGFYKANALEKQ